jgi:hypothetical protein
MTSFWTIVDRVWMVAVTMFSLACSGCCIGNCGIPDLAFVSLQPPPAGPQVPLAMKTYKLAFKPEELQVRFATRRDLFQLGARNDAGDWTLRVFPCADTHTFVTLTEVFTDDGWTVSTVAYMGAYKAHGAYLWDATVPPLPKMEAGPGGLFIYQASGRLNELYREFKGQYGYQLARDRLPDDPAVWPPLCMRLGGSGYSDFSGSNVAPIPKDAVVAAIDALRQRHSASLH